MRSFGFGLGLALALGAGLTSGCTESDSAGQPRGDSGSGGASGAAGVAGAGAVGGGVTTRVNLNFNLDWRFHSGDASGAEASGFDDSAWSYVDLPHSTDWVTPETPSALLGVSWYRKHFSVDAAYQGSKVFIEFEAAMQLADVWVNGTHLTQHQGGYAPFTIDVTQNVMYGADNLISVKLDNRGNSAWAPGWDGVDFQYHGGLYRNVHLYVTNALHITEAVYANKVASGGVFVTYPVVAVDSAQIAVATHVLNEGAESAAATVQSDLVDSTGQVVGSASSPAMIGPGADASVSHTITLANPELWDPDHPNLYTLQTTVLTSGAPVDQYATRVGIRRINWSHAGGLSINGMPFKAIGVNLHQETFGLGNAVPDQAISYEVKRIKEGGSNFIRGSHYPHSPAFYDACDEFGVLVLNAQTGWQQFDDTDAFKNATYQELRDLIRRDRNHPSVVAWEASLNESNYSGAWAQAAHGIVHEEYPGDQAYSAQWILSSADIKLGSSQAGVRNVSDSRPIIIDEFGDWDYGGASSTSRQAREAGDIAMLTQADNIEDGMSKNFALSWFSAGSYWDYADYGGFTSYGITRCGMVDLYRRPKFSYFLQQSQRDPKIVQDGVDSGPMVYIANQWTATSPTTVRVYSNCEQVALYLNDVLVATQAPDPGKAMPHPPFNFVVPAVTPGTLRADCLMGGIVQTSSSRTTPGAPAAIVLRPEATTLLADASDARLVFIDVVDQNGTVVPTDASSLALAVSGPGVLLGPETVTTKGGQLATWVRGTRSPGTITLSATGQGLTSASLDLESQLVTGLPPLPPGR
jgi:hypothetical protein